jgi:tRNA threonylcarbamoyladenosine biosynthesis protein TsaE
MIRLALADAAATVAAGAALGRATAHRPGLVVYLRGELGAGKTTLARGWLRALGADGAIRSPTYTLVEPYELNGRSTLHVDLYRLQGPAELEQLGLADTPPDRSLWLVEWPERAGGRLPPADLDIFLRSAGGLRPAKGGRDLVVAGAADLMPAVADALANSGWAPPVEAGPA